jgi:hypothetical protein
LDGFASSIGTSYVYSSISFYLSDWTTDDFSGFFSSTFLVSTLHVIMIQDIYYGFSSALGLKSTSSSSSS